MSIAFVLGAPRSGTTLLRVMLAGHPDLFVPPEMILAIFQTMAERKAKLEERFWEKGGLRRALMDLDGLDVDAAKAAEAALLDRTIPDVYAWLQGKLGARMLVDKCPHLAASPEALERLDRWFPDARWIWIVRHPGSVVRSVENMPMAEVLLQGYADGPREMWGLTNGVLRRFFDRLPDARKRRVKYEDLVATPEPVMRGVCETLGVPFHPLVLEPYEGDRMRDGPPGARAVGDPNLAGRTQIEPELATKWLAGFDPASVGPITHQLARELGYDLGALAPPPIAAVTASLSSLFDVARGLEAKAALPMDLDALEGRRFLLRMLGASVDLFVEHGDPDRPSFHDAEGPTRKMFADNPDAHYHRAPISLADGRVYRIDGRIPPGTTYVGFLYYGKGGRIGARTHDRALNIAPDGTFTLWLAADGIDVPGDVLRGQGDENAIFVRHYLASPAEPPIALRITRVAGPPPGAALDAPGLARALDKARRNLEAVFTRTLETYKMASVAALNRFVAIGGEQLFPTPDNKYLACWFRLGADQCLIVRGRVPKARYVSVCLYNAWMESYDEDAATGSGPTHLNHTTLVAEDGTFTLLIGPNRLGHTNWLDTRGHLAGYALVRVLLPEEEIAPWEAVVRWERELG